MIQRLRKRLIAGILIGILVVIGVVVISDASALADALREFDWRLLPLILLLALLNYLLRFVKWQYYLRVLGIGPVDRRESGLIFVAGFTMVMTPGKVGELLKSYLLRVRYGVPMAKSGPIIIAERVTDGLAMLVLAGIGLIAFRDGWELFVASALVATFALIFVQHESSMRRLLGRAGASRPFRGRQVSLEQLYLSTRTLLGPKPFGVGVAIGVVSWFGECLAFYLVLIGLGLDQSARLLLAATFVFAAAAWIGGLSLVPGGLGVAEASVAGLLLLVVDDPLMTGSLAATATLLIRFATLWFGVLLGVVALARVSSWTSDEDSGQLPETARGERERIAAINE